MGDKHHYVPACYLRHFAIPNDRYAGKLHVYDRTTGARFELSPDKAAREGDFYTVEIDGKASPLAEDTYERLETRFAPAIADVNERGTLPRDPAEMRVLLAFVASQASRTPRVRELQAKSYRDTHMLFLHQLASDKEAFVQSVLRDEPDVSATDAGKMHSLLRESLDANRIKLDLDKTGLIRDTLELAGEIEDILMHRHWILGRAPDGSNFITTDDPVNLQPARPEPPRNPLWSPGFGDANTNVLVPLSPRLLLIGLPFAIDRARLRLSRADVAGINMGLAMAARRFIFSIATTVVHIGEDGAVIDGPTEALRRIERSEASPLGFFRAPQ